MFQVPVDEPEVALSLMTTWIRGEDILKAWIANKGIIIDRRALRWRENNAERAI
jgi:hypothetical protein